MSSRVHGYGWLLIGLLGCNALAGNDELTFAASQPNEAGVERPDPPPTAAKDAGEDPPTEGVDVGAGEAGRAGAEAGGRGGEAAAGEPAPGAAEGGKGGQGDAGRLATAGRPGSGAAGKAAAAGSGGKGGQGGLGAQAGRGGTGGAGAASPPPTGCARPNPPCRPDAAPMTRDVDCARCGSERQTRACDPTTCEWGDWSSGGECAGQGVCEPGATMAGPAHGCGDCSLGSQATVVTCNDSCAWSMPVDSGACTGGTAACKAGATEKRRANCTTCGTREQTRTCSAQTCAWGGWTNSSACTWCEECAEVVYCDAPNERGTWCRQLACSREQAEADCDEDIEGVCGRVVQPYYFEPR